MATSWFCSGSSRRHSAARMVRSVVGSTGRAVVAHRDRRGMQDTSVSAPSAEVMEHMASAAHYVAHEKIREARGLAQFLADHYDEKFSRARGQRED